MKWWFRKYADEREELESLRVERLGYYLFLFGLAIAIFVQVVMGLSPAHIAGEIIILLVGGTCATVGYARRGIWDSFSGPSMKSYIITSLVMGLISGSVSAYVAYSQAEWIQDVRYDVIALTGAISFAIIFVFMFVLLAGLGSAVKKRRKRLAQQYEDKE